MTYVMDANAIIHFLRKKPVVRRKIREAVEKGDKLLIPRAVDYEICRGLDILNATKLGEVYGDMTSSEGLCTIVDMGESIWQYARKIYVELYRKHFTVGEIDIIIAAFCILHGHTLVTANVKDFKEIEGLRVENWALDNEHMPA